MKVVIAPDSFKGTLSSEQASEAILRGVLRAIPDAECTLVPMADGGEGTEEVLKNSFPNAKTIYIESVDPHGTPIRVACSLLSSRIGALDVATASGLSLVPPTSRNEEMALSASTFGTGVLLSLLLDQGVDEIFIGLGGSATTDGGYGLLGALGAAFYDKSGTLLDPMDASGLSVVHRIETDGLHRRLPHVKIHLLCDVDNILCGSRGAATVFGPQKGLLASGIEKRDAELSAWATLMMRTFNSSKNVSEVVGSGAAGGIAVPLLLLCNAEVERGAQVVANLVGLSEHISTADFTITGEGCADGQTMHGKVPHEVARLSHSMQKATLLVAGRFGDECETLFDAGFTYLVESSRVGASDEDVRKYARDWVTEATYVMVTDYISRKQ